MPKFKLNVGNTPADIFEASEELAVKYFETVRKDILPEIAVTLSKPGKQGEVIAQGNGTVYEADHPPIMYVWSTDGGKIGTERLEEILVENNDAYARFQELIRTSERQIHANYNWHSSIRY